MELNLTGNLRPISVRDSDHLRDDDIVVMEAESGFVRSLYRPYERHHFLFVTERCSSNCLMCSQPPKDKDDVASLAERNLELIRLMDPCGLPGDAVTSWGHWRRCYRPRAGFAGVCALLARIRADLEDL